MHKKKFVPGCICDTQDARRLKVHEVFEQATWMMKIRTKVCKKIALVLGVQRPQGRRARKVISVYECVWKTEKEEGKLRARTCSRNKCAATERCGEIQRELQWKRNEAMEGANEQGK